MKNKIIIVGVVLLLAIGGGVWFFRGGPIITIGQQQVSKGDAVDAVSSFYNPWLKALQSTTTNPYKEGLDKTSILSKALQIKLAGAQSQGASNPDPVLCQTITPTKLATRTVFQGVDKAQIVVTDRNKKSTDQALVNLIKLNGGWYIDDITCSLGEFGVDKEYSFENVGFLLKGSIPKPYNPKDWHIVYQEDGVNGNVVPIFFGKGSICTTDDGKTSVCDVSLLQETMKVSVHGQMTERGVDVQKMEFPK
jgi:hypothetical protein